MSNNTKDRIISFLERNYDATVSELSHTIGVTKANIHYHLKIMIKNGVLESFPKIYTEQENDKGRPPEYFRLARRTKNSNFKCLAVGLLNVFLENEQDENCLKILDSLAVSMFPEVSKQPTVVTQLQQTIDLLDPMHYQPRWEIKRTGPHIYFRNCPYHEIRDQFPILCSLDQVILKRLTGLSVEQLMRIDQESSSIPACVFRMQ